VATWLRGLGFTATERDQGTVARVEAYWQSARGLRFYLDYQWSPRQATCSLALYSPGVREPVDLVSGQHVRRLKDVRQLLLHDVCFHAEWQAAPSPSVPTYS
jgi:hypothetical protein